MVEKTMMLNMATWCDVARSADAAAASLREAGVRVTTAGAWQAPLVLGSGRAVLDDSRSAARSRRDGESAEVDGDGDMDRDMVVSVRATTAEEVPGMLRVEVACGASARTMLLPVMGAILV